MNSKEFKEFLNSHGLEYSFNELNKLDNNTNDNKLVEHINKLHKLIFTEISKNGISNQFLYDLRKEINEYELKKVI